MLDDEHGVAKIDETLENIEELPNVVEVEARGGLIENVESAAGLALGKFTGQFDALGLAAGKGGGGLAERDIAEADFDERCQLLLNLGNIFEDLQRVGRGKI